MASFLPSLATADVQRAAQVPATPSALIRVLTSPCNSLSNSHTTPYPHTASPRTTSAASKPSCSSCSADGRPGDSSCPSCLSIPTRTCSSSAHTPPRSRSPAIGTRPTASTRLPAFSDPLQGELPGGAQRRARRVFARYYGSLDRPSP